MPNVDAKTSQPRAKSRDVKIGLIEDLDRDDCIERWRAMFDLSPPKYTSVEFMRKALAYEAQIKAFGGHSKTVQRIFKTAPKVGQSRIAEDAIGETSAHDTVAGISLANELRAGSPDQPIGGGTSLIESVDLEPAVAAQPVGLTANPSVSSTARRSNPKRKLKPSLLSIRAGTHLVREWNGRTYQVEALEKGFRLDGKTYRSLSAIAKKITGAHWSGPRFFGLES